MGLEVHEDSVEIATADACRDGEVCHAGSIGADLVALDKALRKPTGRGRKVQLTARVSWEKACVTMAKKNA
jgi:transposase